MGNTDSTDKNQPIKTVPRQSGQQSQGLPFDAKKVLFLHKSNAAQLRVVRNFRDALNAKSQGTIHITNFVNIADGSEIPKNLAWLDELNNVVLICLTLEAIEDFQRIIREKRFADENGRIHGKVFSITFGESLASKWPPKGLKKGTTDLRDFHFGFSDVEKLRPQDFDRSLRLNSLVAAIKGTDSMEQST